MIIESIKYVNFTTHYKYEKDLIALLKMCKSYGVSPKLHLFTDGRDDDPKSALKIFEFNFLIFAF